MLEKNIQSTKKFLIKKKNENSKSKSNIND